ncbi:MAG: hypothetical protein LBE09_06515 [Christensenellaceae bacterium]|nr:hypothetical protein [Christensenellaceae bacterium]
MNKAYLRIILYLIVLLVTLLQLLISFMIASISSVQLYNEYYQKMDNIENNEKVKYKASEIIVAKVNQNEKFEFTSWCVNDV